MKETRLRFSLNNHKNNQCKSLKRDETILKKEKKNKIHIYLEINRLLNHSSKNKNSNLKHLEMNKA